MFGFARKRQEEPSSVVPETPAVERRLADVIPFPVSQIPQRVVSPETQRSYEGVAQQLGFVPAELTRAQLLEFFEEAHIHLYDYGQVRAWLTRKRKAAGLESWCWRPLREKDSIVGYVWGISRGRSDGYHSSKLWECRPYERLVPLHALEKVAKIEAKFADRVKFFVSDYVDPNVDPFIMVRPAMCDSGTEAEYNLVFDVWDEPGFGD